MPLDDRHSHPEPLHRRLISRRIMAPITNYIDIDIDSRSPECGASVYKAIERNLCCMQRTLATVLDDKQYVVFKGGGALCAGNAVALLVFGPVMP